MPEVFVDIQIVSTVSAVSVSRDEALSYVRDVHFHTHSGLTACFISSHRGHVLCGTHECYNTACPQEFRQRAAYESAVEQLRVREEQILLEQAQSTFHC